MKKLLGLLTVAALLSSCGSYVAAIIPDIGIAVNDAPAVAEITESISDKGVKTLAIKKAQAAEFVMTSRPGSVAVYIEGYRVVSDIIDNDETVADPYKVFKTNIFVPSGFSCANQTNAQSCSISDPTTFPANGLAAPSLFLDIANDQIGAAITKRGSIVRYLTLEFYGRTANYEPYKALARTAIGQVAYVVN
jgi:uncharacterized protein YceK